jgi:MFS family permease
MLAIETETHEDAVWIFTFGTVVWAVGGSIIGWIAGPFGSAVSTTIGRCGVGLAIGAFVGAVLATFAGLVNGVVADDIDVAAVARGLAIAGVVGGAFIGAASGGFSTGKPGAGSS